ncbi:CDP-diacylglycerol--serine O-phosphatidyltransferase [invertebrate metagenome]|uniref:CDP-diacylglycerol--serine O-phosphatidyltransferase n=1 Tax=invertebrate metagenome TaxID=1711999 RepID=A0A484H5H2_9ZZZZ
MFRSNRPARLRDLKDLSINRMIPNILTLFALCAGVTAIRYGLHEEWEKAIIAIGIAAVFDGLDGRIARLLRGTSKFGAELDSLSDFVGFGVAPALLIYLWTMQNAGGLGWALVLLFPVCAALRLARFNTMAGTPDPPPFVHSFFIGVPTPAGAGIVLLPMIVWFQYRLDWLRHPLVASIFLVSVSLLEISRIPTYSFRRVRVQHRYVLPVMLLVGMLAAFLVTEPWTTLSVLGLLYLASLPLSLRAFRRLRPLS